MRRAFRGGNVTLKHIKIVRKPNGATYRYLALPGQKMVGLPDGPMDAPSFLAAYAAAMQGAERNRRQGKAMPGTIAAAIDGFESSARFAAYSPATKSRRMALHKAIRAKAGAGRVNDLQTRHVEADLRGLQPHAANTRRKAWRALLAWAKEQGLIDADPSLTVAKRRTEKTDGHEPWAADDIAMFRAHWPTESPQRLAMELIYWTAARCVDAVRLGPGMVDRDGWLCFTQSKTGDAVAIPFARALPAFAHASDLAELTRALDARPDRHLTWITTAYGAARSIKAFSQWFSEAAKAAGVTKTAHGLRKSRAIALAESGATAHQIGAWTGHASLSEIQHYTQAADKRRILSVEHKGGAGLETTIRKFPNSAASD